MSVELSLVHILCSPKYLSSSECKQCIETVKPTCQTRKEIVETAVMLLEIPL